MNYSFLRKTALLFATSLSLVFALLWGMSPQQARAAGQVTTCTETALDAALSGGGLVTFACDGTITLSHQKTISADTTLDASGRNVILDGGNSVRIFNINPGASLTLRHLTLQNGSGSPGGAISISQGGVSLTIEDSQVLSNTSASSGGAIFADVISTGDPITITIARSVFDNNQASSTGGAIFIDGGEGGVTVGALLEISDSTFSDNRANLASTSARGGAIYANYHVTINIEGALFDHNRSGGLAGALLSNNSPNPANQVNLANSTFSNNSAGYAVSSANDISGGAMMLTNANLVHNTFTGNYLAGGDPARNKGIAIVWASNTFTVTSRDNIFHNNDTSTGRNVCSGNYGSNNLTDDGTCNYPNGGNAVTNFDATLKNNGGPTKTHALQSGSNALDSSSSCTYVSTGTNNLFTNGDAITRDQRGAARPYGSSCDKGAFERHEILTQGTCGGSDLSGDQVFSFSSGDTLTITVGTANGLNCITVEEMGADHLIATGPGPTNGTLATGNWWHITGNITSTFDVTITLPFSGADTQSRVCKYPGNLGGYGWDCDDGTTTTYISGVSVTRSGITSFSDWAVGDKVGPTAVHLTQLNGHSASSLRGVLLAALSIALPLAGFIFLRRIRKPKHQP
jgi:predicted outer membrane repeat protein